MAFIDDIQSRDTALFPFVDIGINHNNVALPTSIRISTKAVTLFQASSNDELTGDWFYKPLLLSSPSIKESIDLENRKYKISNVSLKISNVEYNGERVSDNPELKINARTKIKWMSPSLTRSNDGYMAYIGVIRAITHDEKTCSITLEDISQSSLHRDVPVALLGTGKEIPDKYRNKPIPMVYGTVYKSPCVIYRDTVTETDLNGDITILADNTLNVNGDANPIQIGGYNNQPDYLSTYDNDYYATVLKKVERNLGYAEYDEDGNLTSGVDYLNKDQYTYDNYTITMPSYFGGNVDINTIADNLIQCRYNRKPNSFHLKSQDDNYRGKIYGMNLFPTGLLNVYTDNEFVGNIVSSWDKVADGNVNTSMEIHADNFGGELFGTDHVDSYTQMIGFEFGFDMPDFDIKSPIITDVNMWTRHEWGDWTIEEDYTTLASGQFWYHKYDDPSVMDFNLLSYTNAWGSQGRTDGVVNYYHSILYPPVISDENPPVEEVDYESWSPTGISGLHDDFSDIKKVSFISDYLHTLSFPKAGWEFMKINIYELYLRSYFDLSDIRKREFFADVNGRTS